MKKRILSVLGAFVITTVVVLNVILAKKGYNTEISLNSLLNLSQAQGESTCCIGDKFRIEPIPGGWRCVNNEGNSCCPIC